jgi:hypothetical protein
MINSNKKANRNEFLKVYGTHLLVLLLAACVVVAEYNQPHPPSGYNQYPPHSNPYQPSFLTRDLVQQDVKNCTDLNCGMEQCCVETPRSAICVDLTITNITTNERLCVRPKLCNTDFDCFTDGCCVYNSYITADATCPDKPDYAKHPPHSYPGQVVRPTSGVCMPKVNAANSTCFLSITGNPMCPCGTDDDTSLSCQPLFAGSIIGTCQVTP